MQNTVFPASSEALAIQRNTCIIPEKNDPGNSMATMTLDRSFQGRLGGHQLETVEERNTGATPSILNHSISLTCGDILLTEIKHVLSKGT